MAIINCKKCGKMFSPFGDQKICQACKDALEEKYQEVKRYVDEHKVATMTQICEDCEVDQKQVQQWVREERLIFADNSQIKFNCEHCGAVINTGRFCEKCKKAQADVFGNAFQRKAAPTLDVASKASGVRMHTFKN
ncbi:MAG: flagellar protein [Lachnospiraceae bacterium]|nr:flagellar protein [Lachnospiraceae bacterium]